MANSMLGRLFHGTFLSLAVSAFAIAPGQTPSTKGVSTGAPPIAAGQSSPSVGGTQPIPHRSMKRSRRRYVAPTPPSQAATGTQTVGPDAAQRTRDAQILAAQKARSAEIARQNAITTGNVVKEREAQQAEPRIQDAPGPGSQPLAGDPAVQPAQSGDAPRIQDAPGPAQTLPKAPPAQPAPQAQEQTAPPS